MADKILTRGCMYKLTFPNGKAYIGITTRTAEKRFLEHRKSAKMGRPLAVNRAINKYGWQEVRVETLIEANWPYLLELEQKAIVSFGTKGEGGYNMTNGGDGVVGMTPSPETREKLRIANLGKKASEETIARMKSAAKNRVLSEETLHIYRTVNIGRVKSEETRARLSAANKGKKLSPQHIEKMRILSLGRKHDEKAREKMSAANKGRVMTAEHRAKLSASATGRKMSADSIAKQWATRKAKQLEQDHQP